MSGHETSRQPGAPTVRHVQIVQLSPAALHALAAGDLAAANTASTVPLTPEFVGPDWRGIWRRRSAQVVDDPGSAAWITGVVVDVERRLAVGSAGYHGPPDAAGMVEIGYAVVPTFRRQGYARAALEALLARAASEADVRTVRATIRPDNVASRNLVRQYGFVEVGEQWDDEDGLETIFEVPATAPVVAAEGASMTTAAPEPSGETGPQRVQPAPGDITFARAIPILRIFDVAKAREFYLDYLGFTVDWEHRFEPDLPLYLQVSRSGLILHLSEHHGDGTPGSVIFCEMTGIKAFHAELMAKRYRYYRPGLSRESYGLSLSVQDGFGNGLRFCERT